MAKPIEAPKPVVPASKQKTISAQSWWTTRAKSGDVAPGFNRETILRKAPEDPRAPGGVFERLGQVLELLSRGLLPS